MSQGPLAAKTVSRGQKIERFIGQHFEAGAHAQIEDIAGKDAFDSQEQ